jgi:hypothetical protein
MAVGFEIISTWFELLTVEQRVKIRELLFRQRRVSQSLFYTV